MAVQLFKLKIEVESILTTDLHPDVKQYFYELDPEDIDEGTLTAEASSFVDDEGNAATAFEALATDNGYYCLFINGALQQKDLYSIEELNTELVITDAETIPAGALITLTVTNFVPVSSADNTVIT
ncbi:MAG: DUF4183 domain-containing protein [Alkaliphilus sp.]|nr:DUF4183 domain-containing protein [Alkaliphilus sp.]